MTAIDAADALLILTKIRTFHGPQDTGTSVCHSWAEALNYAGVASVPDALQAVVRHYSTPGCNQWITPGDVVAGVKAIRAERMQGVNDGDLTPDLDPFAPARDYVATTQARAAAVMDGMPVRQAIATIAPVKAIEAVR